MEQEGGGVPQSPVHEPNTVSWWQNLFAYLVNLSPEPIDGHVSPPVVEPVDVTFPWHSARMGPIAPNTGEHIVTGTLEAPWFRQYNPEGIGTYSELVANQPVQSIPTASPPSSLNSTPVVVSGGGNPTVITGTPSPQAPASTPPPIVASPPAQQLGVDPRYGAHVDLIPERP